MGCGIESIGDSPKLFDRLMKLTNNDKLRAIEYFVTINKSEFADWFKTNTGTELDITNMSKISPSLIKLAKQYINVDNFAVSNTVQKYNTSRTGVFGNDLLKEEHAINVLASLLLKGENILLKNKKVVTPVLLKQALVKQLELHKQKNKEALTEDQIDFVNTIILNLHDNGRFANNELYSLVIRHPNVNNLSKTLGLFKKDEVLLNDDEAFDEEVDSKTEEVIETLREDWSSMADEKANYDKNISKEIKELFAVTGETISTELIDGNPNYNSATYSGIPESISFIDYYKTIMTNANFDNADDFVKSLFDIADKFPNRSSLSVIAEKFNKEDIVSVNLKNKIYSQFNQARVERNELQYSANNIEVRLRNRGSNPRIVLYDNAIIAFNNLINSPINVAENSNIIVEQTQKLKESEKLKDEPKSVALLEIKEKLVDIFNSFNVGVTEEGIDNYIKFNKGGNTVNNLNNLFQIAEAFNNALIATIPSVIANNEVRKKHYSSEAITKIEAEERGESYLSKPVPSEQFTDVSKNGNKVSNLIAETFASYQLVNLEFNSLNVENNLVSDILKPNMLKRFFDRLDNQGAALEFFSNLSMLEQYRNSNILFEQRDSTGKLLVPGILRKNNAITELTPYYKFLSYQLFNGARNEVLNTVKTYSKMTKTEWDITSLNEFNNNGETNTDGGFRLSKYFIQTPSDAPKTFSITSYRLPIDRLYGATINRNHPIYKSLENSMMQEFNRAGQALVFMFETTEDDNGNIRLKRTKVLKSKPILKKEFKVEDLSNTSLNVNYHYSNGQIFNKDGSLAGNIFKLKNLNLDESSNPETNPNYIVDANGNRISDFLYGGSGKEQSIDLVRNNDGQISVVLNDSQKEAIRKYIDNYLNVRRDTAIKYYANYINHVQGYNSKVEGLTKEQQAVQDTASRNKYNDFVTSYALNYTIQYINFNELFFGDPSYYKGAQDTIKRNKQHQAGGLINGAYELNDSIDKKLTRVTIGDKEIIVKSTFSYITLNDVERPANNVTDIKKQLEEAKSPESVKQFILGKFTSKTNATDAQTFITLDEFVKRVVLTGEFENYKDTIETLYDESKPINFSKLSKLIQVQKNFYYGLDVDTNTGIRTPVQIKNAEFVLIPRFLGNTELALLNDTMLKNNIGQANFVSTEKASTNKVLTFWDKAGNISDEGLKVFESQLTSSTKNGWYANLYKQQDAPQHMDDVNKAGVQIVKKMLDNIDNVPQGRELIDKFFNNFNANIQDSFMELSERIGVKFVDGQIQYANGEPIVDIEEFYNIIRDELTSRGVDSNLISYATLENGQPLMPTYTNNVRSKLESVIQAIFTNNITRQTIPGFHASQITSVGMKSLGEVGKDKTFTQSKFEEAHGYKLGRELQYHPNGENYIEVLLPQHMKRMYNTYDADGTLTYEFSVEDLANAGLDYMIGYRIPTEGKQSVVRLKVVGFLNEAQGSTIVVPDGFVTQTGSDFDIDSVYGMYHNVRFNRDGKISKIQYLDDSNSTVEDRYYNYVKSNLSKEDKTKIYEESKLDKEEKQEVRKRVRNELREKYGFVFDVDNAISEELSKEYQTNYKAALDYSASKLGLKTLEQFSNQSIELQNSREARNNQIVDTFLEIMEMTESWEENLMSSNFDDIKVAKELVFGKQETYRNINTFESQSEYRSMVMDGAVLKAVSVKADAFVSISSVAKTKINSESGGFKFSYDVPIGETFKKFKSRLSKTFGKENVKEVDGRLLVDHKFIGWSYNNNRNIDNKLITVYSSETTALILDGVKEGGVPNVNGYTFDVYKAIVSVGSDYRTSILFVNQPAVKMANNIYDANANIFEANNSSPIYEVKRDLYKKLAESLGIITLKEYDNIKVIEEALKKLRGFEIDKSVDFLSVEDMQKHINDKLNTTDNILYQIKVLNSFEHFKRIADTMNAHSNVLNVDKVGAGQSVNESVKLIKDIHKIELNNEKQASKVVVLDSAITNNSLIDSIYPNTAFDNVNDIIADDSKSVYPSLYYQLKYGVIASSAISGTLFKTHSPKFKMLKAYLNSKDLVTIKEFENYIISSMMNKADVVVTNRFRVKDNSNKLNNYDIDVTAPSDYDNRSRLFGFNQELINDFDFKNVTEDNVRKFMLLTPANKILLLQSNTKEDDLFKRLTVNIQDDRIVSQGRHSAQKINITDSGIGYEQLYQLFKTAYNNDNPFVKLAAIDLVRYSIAVEGYKFKGGSVSKIIPTELLYGARNKYDSKDGVSYGLGITNDTNVRLENFLQSVNLSNMEGINTVIENFYRSYNSSKDIIKFENRKGNNKKAISFRFNGMAVLTAEEANSHRLVKSTTNGIPEYYEFVMTNSNTSKKGKTKLDLYKVKEGVDGIYLYPINKLEPNEIGEVSVNPDYTVVPSPSVYKAIIKANDNSIGTVTINNLTALERAKYSINRDCVVVSNLNEKLYTSPLEESTVLDLWLSTMPKHNLINSKDDLSTLDNSIRSVIIANDVAETLDIINELESIGYSNYLVISQNTATNDIKSIISAKNRQDVKDIKDKQNVLKLEARKANVVTRSSDGKESGSYKQFKTLIDNNSIDVINNGVTFISVMPELMTRLNFTPASYHRITRNNVDYVVTNIGEVNRKNMNLIPEYNESLIQTTTTGEQMVFPKRDIIINAVKEGSIMSAYNKATIVKVETLQHFNNETRESTLEETDQSINQYISEVVASVARTDRNVEDSSISEVAKAFVNLDIRVNNSSKFNDTLREAALKIINGYTTTRSDYMFSRILDFYEGLSISNPKLFELMINDDVLRTEYENFIDSISRFIEDYSAVSRIELYDIKEAELLGATQDELADLRRTNDTLTQIKTQFTKMNNLTNKVNNSVKMFFNSVIASTSNDPRLRSKMMELTEVLDDENWAQLKFGNIAETHIPIVQVVLKEVMTNLRAAEINARDKRISFRTEIDNIISSAKATGYEVSLNDIVDESGKLILPYTQQFLDDLTDLKQKLNIAGIEDPNGRNGVIYKKAKAELEDFMTNHLERQYVSDLYKDYAKLDNDLLKYPDVYTKLKGFMFEQSQILSTMIDNDYSTLTDEKTKRLKEITDEIAEMRMLIDVDGNYKENYYEAKAVDDYYLNRKLLDNKYKETKAKNSFIEKLNQIKEDLKFPETSETYRAAKEWLDNNTYRKLSEEFSDKLSKAYAALRTTEKDPYISTISKGKYDKAGILNGNLFNETQVANIKKHQEAKNKDGDINSRLIRNGEVNREIYTTEFYNSMRSGSQTPATRTVIDSINAILLPYYNNALQRLETSQISLTDLAKLDTLYNSLNANNKILNIDENGNISIIGSKTKSDVETAKFIEDEVTFDYDITEYNRQRDAAKANGPIYFKKWLQVNSEFIRSSEHYEAVNAIGVEVSQYLKTAKNSRLVSIVKSIRILEFLKPNNDYIGDNEKDRINNNKESLGYYLDYLTGKTYRDGNVRTLNDIISNTPSTSPVKATLDAYRDKIKTLSKDSTLDAQLNILNKAGKLELTNEYKDQLAFRDVTSIDIFDDEWYLANHTIDDNGRIVPIGENYKFVAKGESTELKPNSKIYGTVKATHPEKWIDSNKTAANKFISDNTEFNNTPYYEAKYREMKSQGDDVFQKWYNDNHVYNSYSHKYEPLAIWKSMKIKNDTNYTYEPKSKWLETNVRDVFNNTNYEQGKIVVKGSKYSNPAYTNMNPKVRELYNATDRLMNDLVKDKRSRTYLNKGYLPSQAIEDTSEKGFKDYWKDFAKSHGWYDAPINSEAVASFNQREVNAPMLHTLSKTKLIKLRERGDGESAKDYSDYVKQTNEENKILQKQIVEENKQMNNPNLGERLDAFIEQMYAHNSMKESARLMKITASQLRNLEFITRDAKGRSTTDKILERITGNEQVIKNSNDGSSNISKHFETQMRKLIYNEFEKDEGTKSKVSRVLRNIVSARFMMGNVTGGIANVVYGKSQIQMERAAGSQFAYKDFLKAEWEYKDGIMAYFADAYRDTTNNEVNAIIRLFNVIDLQDVREKYGSKETAFSRIENALYLQQTMGEHYMQNTTLLAMLNSHRIVKDRNGKAKAISFETYNQDMREEVLLDTLKKYDNINNTKFVEEYEKTINVIKSSLANKEQYIRFKRDAITEFLRSKDNNLRSMFSTNYDSIKKENKEVFDKLPTFRDQLELRNGIAVLKEDSELTNESIAEFRGKVIDVNHHIHGVYDKVGANTIQQTWLGALAMQFHKHLVPGFAKRFGYRLGHLDGVYSETRETVSKGAYVSLADFITMPFRKHYEVSSDGELVAVEALQNILKGFSDFVSNYKTYYNILPDYDKANLNRVVSEWASVAKALLMFAVGKLMLDEDDESTQIADYILYSADRLISESIQYSPYGMLNETQKLYSNPIAALSTIKETQKAISAVASYVITGDKESLIYQTGTWYGENKITTALWKQVPVYNQWMKHERLGVNNSYYKVRANPIQGLLKDLIDK